ESLVLKGKKKSIGFKHARDGILVVFKSERNFRIHLLIGTIVLLLGYVLNLPLGKWLAIILVIGLVLVAERLTSAIERMLDYLNPSIHPSAKIIKDIAAGAVLISAIAAVIIGVIIFIPEFYQMMF